MGAMPRDPLSARTWEELAADEGAALKAGIPVNTSFGAGSASDTSGIATKTPIGFLASVQSYVEEHPVAVGATAGGLAAIAAGTAVALSGRKRKASHRRSTGTGRRKAPASRKKRKSKLKFGSPAWRKKYARNARRRRALAKQATKSRNRRGGAVKDRYKGKKVLRTKRGQPYIILANGKARFVKA